MVILIPISSLFFDVLRLQLNGYEVNVASKPVMVFYTNDFNLIMDYCRWSRLNEISYLRGTLKDLLVQHFDFIQYLQENGLRYVVIYTYMNTKVRLPNLLIHENHTNMSIDFFRSIYRDNTALYPTKDVLLGGENVKTFLDRLTNHHINVTVLWLVGGIQSEQVFRNFITYLTNH